MRTTVTKEYIEKRIKDVNYHVLPGTTVTMCVMEMANGYKVLGKSACVNPDNFDAAEGRKWAYEDAIDEAWPLEGYLLAEELSRSTTEKRTYAATPLHGPHGQPLVFKASPT
jgi:hypothetical protein